MDWLLQPVMRGLIKFESLQDKTLDLADVALLNDALAVEAENQARARTEAERKR